jgi:hypothetical protein
MESGETYAAVAQENLRTHLQTSCGPRVGAVASGVRGRATLRRVPKTFSTLVLRWSSNRFAEADAIAPSGGSCPFVEPFAAVFDPELV